MLIIAHRCSLAFTSRWMDPSSPWFLCRPRRQSSAQARRLAHKEDGASPRRPSHESWPREVGESLAKRQVEEGCGEGASAVLGARPHRVSMSKPRCFQVLVVPGPPASAPMAHRRSPCLIMPVQEQRRSHGTTSQTVNSHCSWPKQAAKVCVDLAAASPLFVLLCTLAFQRSCGFISNVHSQILMQQGRGACRTKRLLMINQKLVMQQS